MRSLHRSPLSLSIPCLIATNSAPKTEVSIVACPLDIQSIRAILIKIKMPVQERQVSLLMSLCSCWITTPSVVFLFVCTHRYWYEAHVSHHLIFSWSFVSLVVSLQVHCLTSCLCPFFCHTLSNSCSASFWQFWPIEPL